MKRIFLVLACVLMAGCEQPASPVANSDGPVEIQFWNGFSGPDGATMEGIVKRFNASQRRIRVKMQIIPWGTYYDKLTLGLAFGGAPDVFVLHANRVPEYAVHRAIAPLDGHLKASGLGQADFDPTAWTAGTWQGERFALPLDVHPLGLYYNVDLFRQAGIARPPTNRAEFIDAARRLTKDENGDGRPDRWGFAFTWIHSNGITFLNQYGTGLLTPDLERSDLGSQPARAALENMIDLIRRGDVCPKPEGTDAWMGFQTGRVAMAMEGVYMMSSLEGKKGLNYAAAPVPKFGPKRAVWAGSHCLAMPAKSSGERQKLAWEFVKYLSDHSLEWAKGGQVPVRKSILESPAFRALRVQSEFAKQLPYVVYEPRSPAFNQISVFADSAMESALNGVEPVEQALARADRRVNRVMSVQ